MAGQLSGVFFKHVMNQLTSGSNLFKPFRDKVARMEDEGWYEWDDYKRMVNAVAGKLTPYAVSAVGFNLVLAAKQTFVDQGFDTADKVLKDYGAVFSANVRGAAEDDAPYTVEYHPGTAVIEAGEAQPRDLVEGYLRGFVFMHGKMLQSFRAETIDRDGRTVHRFELSWT